jgi:hypothetical protein
MILDPFCSWHSRPLLRWKNVALLSDLHFNSKHQTLQLQAFRLRTNVSSMFHFVCSLTPRNYGCGMTCIVILQFHNINIIYLHLTSTDPRNWFYKRNTEILYATEWHTAGSLCHRFTDLYLCYNIKLSLWLRTILWRHADSIELYIFSHITKISRSVTVLYSLDRQVGGCTSLFRI